MYHFAWADQREKQGYNCNVSLKRGIQIVVSWENGLFELFDMPLDPQAKVKPALFI